MIRSACRGVSVVQLGRSNRSLPLLSKGKKPHFFYKSGAFWLGSFLSLAIRFGQRWSRMPLPSLGNHLCQVSRRKCTSLATSFYHTRKYSKSTTALFSTCTEAYFTCNDPMTQCLFPPYWMAVGWCGLALAHWRIFD